MEEINEQPKMWVKEVIEDVKMVYELERVKRLSEVDVEEREKFLKDELKLLVKILIDKLSRKFHEEMEKMMEEKLKKLIEENQELKKALMEKDEELEETETLCMALMVKERESNDEIQGAQQQFIEGLREMSSDESIIRVKRMGEIDEKSLMEVCKKRFSGEEAEEQHVSLCSNWKDNLKDPSWYPFKLVKISGKIKEVVDEEDEQLMNLRKEWGEDVENVVKRALVELNDFNPSGRYTVPVMWNFEKREKSYTQGRDCSFDAGDQNSQTQKNLSVVASVILFNSLGHFC